MELLRSWVISVTAAAMVLAAAEAVMPEGIVKKVGKRVGGLVLILVVLNPLVSFDYEALYDRISRLPAEQAWEIQEDPAMEPMKTIIEQELGAYIVDKAAELGVPCTAEVYCMPDENRVPIPTEIILTGDFSETQKQELSVCLEKDLGIKRENQIFRTGGVP